MRRIDPRNLLAVALLSLFACAPLLAQTPMDVRIGELSYLDRQYMMQQRASLEDLTGVNFGRRFNGDKTNDLELLQLLLDRRLVLPDQTQELQAMGVVMGDLLATDLDMHWVIYEDRVGRSRALRYRDTDTFLFPMTMISRRREVGNMTPVTEIYEKARSIVLNSRPALPFQ